MMAAAWALLTLTTGFEPLVLEDRVERVERNTVYDGDAKPVFTQLIFDEPDLTIRAYRIIKCEPYIAGQQMLFWDDGKLRRVRFANYVVTHTQFDREAEDCENRPTRRGLRGLRKR